MVDIQSAAAEIRRGKKKRRRNKPQGKNIMTGHITWGGHNKTTQQTYSVYRVYIILDSKLLIYTFSPFS